MSLLLLSFVLKFITLNCIEPNPPYWPPSVFIFKEGDDNYTQSIVDEVFQENGGTDPPFNGQWSDTRYAFLFLPGTHNVDINVGFYTTIMGLGENPQDTRIRNVISPNGGYYNGDYNALCNFWRNAENFMTTPTMTQDGHPNTMLWAVSQGVSLRRVIINGNLHLSDTSLGSGVTSGGFLSNSYVTHSIDSGSQQQWYTRNVNTDLWIGGDWNMVFQGMRNAPNSLCMNKSSVYTTIESTPVIAEKPFIAYKDSKYYLMIPPVEYNKIGATNFYANNDIKAIDFKHVYVTDAKVDTAASINSKLQSGLNIVFTAGLYNVSEPIKITRSNITVLGIGFPTLMSMNGNIILDVADGVADVRLSGILYDAGPKQSPTLLRVGTKKTDVSGYIFLYDTFARVGGPNNPQNVQYKTEIMVQINANNVILDNSWLWRADHDVSGSFVYSGDNPVNIGLQVNGDHVTAYSLKVEHTLQNMVEWFGDNGACYMFQSEFPYDVNQEQYGGLKYNAFKVYDGVTTFKGYGMGMYVYFRDYTVIVENAIQAPNNAKDIQFINLCTVWLYGLGGINHVINGLGAAVNEHWSDTPSSVCEWHS